MKDAHLIIKKHWQRPADDAKSGESYGLGDTLRAMTIREMVDWILIDAPELMPKAAEFFEKYQSLLDSVLLYQPLQRLTHVRQLGFHSEREPWHFYPHTRLDHSRIVCAHGIVFGLHLGRSFHEIATSAIAALLHDIGHAVYSHDSDYALVAFGLPNHEARSEQKFLASDGLRQMLTHRGFASEEILQVMQEQGSIGVTQSIADTLSYLVLDMAIFGLEIRREFSWQVISSIVGEVDGQLIVSSIEPLQELLEIRAAMYQRVYRSVSCKVGAAALRLVLAEAFHCVSLTPQEVADETDAVVDARIEALLHNGVSPWVRSCWGLVRGVPEELDKWQIAGVKNKYSEWKQTSFHFSKNIQMIAPWYDYAKKTLVVRLPNSQTVKLKAAGNFSRMVDNHSFIFTWKG